MQNQLGDQCGGSGKPKETDRGVIRENGVYINPHESVERRGFLLKKQKKKRTLLGNRTKRLVKGGHVWGKRGTCTGYIAKKNLSSRRKKAELRARNRSSRVNKSKAVHHRKPESSRRRKGQGEKGFKARMRGRQRKAYRHRGKTEQELNWGGDKVYKTDRFYHLKKKSRKPKLTHRQDEK